MGSTGRPDGFRGRNPLTAPKKRTGAAAPVLLAAHGAAYALGVWRNSFEPFDLLQVLLILFNLAAAVHLWKRPADRLLGGGMMFLIAMHSLMGPALAPDPMTSGALLFVNLLVVYVGYQLHRHLPLSHSLFYLAGYLLLFVLFIVILPNAESLFLLFLLGLAATARSHRMTAVFWAVTLSFTFFQPYAWTALLLALLVLTALFEARGPSRSPATLTALACGLALVCLVLLPVLILILGEDPRNMLRLLRDERIRDALWLTITTATASTAILVVFLTPFCYALSRLRFPGRTLLLSLMDLPVVIPQSVAGIALIRIFGHQQALGEFFHHRLGLRFDGTVAGILLAQVFVALPFMARSAMAAFDAVPERLEAQARTLGASAWGAFRRVSLPLAARGVFLGAVLSWARAAGEFGAVLFIAPTPETAPITAYNRFFSVGLVEATPLVAMLLSFSVAMFFLLQYTARLLPDTHGRHTREG